MSVFVISFSDIGSMPNLKNIKLADATLQDFAFAMMSAESDSLKEVSLNEFFGSTERVTSDSEFFDTYEHKKMQFVWKEFFELRGWRIVKEVSFGYLNELPPTMMEIEVSPDNFMKIYKSACIFYVNDKNDKLCTEVSQGPRGGFYYTFHSSSKSDTLFKDLEKLASDKNLYKGKKIDCDCRFLKLDNLSWDDVILPKGVTEVIRSNIDTLFSLRDKFKKFGLSVKRGVILHGPPGTGKTKVCKCLAKDASYSVLYALPSDFNPNTGGIRRVCKMAKDLAPCLLVIEDIDWIAQSRHSGNAPFVMELMNQLDGIESFGDIITLGTTNCLAELEEAVKNRPGRFDRIIKVDLPTTDLIEKMIIRFTSNFIIDSTINVNRLASALDKLTGAHVNDLCTTAAMFAVRDDSMEGDKLLLKKNHFDEAIKEVKDKNYSSYMELQSKQKNFGFSADIHSGLIDDFLDSDQSDF